MAKIAIIGSGVVGQATGKGLQAHGHDILYYDINPVVIERLNQNGYNACNIETCVEEREVFMVSVSTPTVNGHIELSFLQSAIASLGKIIGQRSDYSLIVVRSTVPPGTTEDLVIPIMERFSGKVAGRDFGVCMNPEFLREISAEEDFMNPRIIVAGALDRRSRDKMEEVYAGYDVPKHFVSLKEAEMIKYTHNLMNANKISFFNEMRVIGERMGVNTDTVFDIVSQSAEASWNPMYGTKNLGAYGGTCLPKDTQAFLTWVQEKFKKRMPLLAAVIRVNDLVKELRDKNNH